MDILNPADAKRNKLAERAHGAALLIAFFFLIWVLLAMRDKESALTFKAAPMPSINILKFGKGPLSVSGKEVSPEFEPLLQELVLIGRNTRPDGGAESKICLGFKSSGAKIEVKAGQKIYLTPQYQFTESETPLALIPLPMGESDVILHIESPDKNEEVILTASSLFQKSMDEEMYVQHLKQGKMWSSDLLLNQWGGEEYRELISKRKIEIDGLVYFLSAGDTLWWNGNQWDAEAPLLEGIPVAKVTSSTPQEVKMTVWDSAGYVSYTVNIPLQSSSKIPVKAEEVITSVRPRSPTEVTCQLGKRRVVVKEGDWWVKTDRRWRPLRTADDLEAFLHHHIQGELFIFEKVESGKGKITLQARCFDKMRTQSQPLSLIVNAPQKTGLASRRHESSHSSMIVKNRMGAPLLQQQPTGEEEAQ